MSTARDLTFMDIFPTGNKHNYEAPCQITLKHSGQIKPIGKLIYKGDHIHVHKTCELDLTADIEIHEYTNISGDVKIFTHRHHWNHSRDRRGKIEIIEPVKLVIEEDVYVGRCATIIGVERIGKGAIIGGCAVLTKNVAPYEVWAGNPARKINERKDDT